MKAAWITAPEPRAWFSHWAAHRIEGAPRIAADQVLAVQDNAGRLVAAVLYHDYRGCSIELSCAAVTAHWLTPGILRTIFAYPFTQLQCHRVTATVAEQNRHTRRFVERIGFRLEGVLEEALDGHNACIYGMLWRRCRWVNHGQENTEATARA